MSKTPDFGGWATKAGVVCADGRTVMPDAFKHQDTMTVPLVWQHDIDTPSNILGRVELENRPEGVFAHAFFNNSKAALDAREAVRHGDISHLSIRAGSLIEEENQVIHGMIREVSLVVAGANPEARIEDLYITHDVTGEFEAILFTGLPMLRHSSLLQPIEPEEQEEDIEVFNESNEDSGDLGDILHGMDEDQQMLTHALLQNAITNSEDPIDIGDRDAEEILHSMSYEQSVVLETLINDALENNNTISHSLEGQTMNQTRNVFDTTNDDTPRKATLSHSQISTIVEDAKQLGSFKESVLQHAAEYGIQNVDFLFPEAKNITESPDFISRRMEWVNDVLSSVRKTPFSRIRSIHADITEDEARAKGYTKGGLKMEEVFPLLRRSTGPTTVYKKQKLDRDDIIDITDFDIVVWLKQEMRLLLDEEIARAILIGDGRLMSSPDKIKDPAGAADGVGVRSIVNDSALYVRQVTVTPNTSPTTLIETVLRNRKHYRGSGRPTFYTNEDVLTDMLLVKDKLNRRLYNSEDELATALRVARIVPIDVLENYKNVSNSMLLGVMVNLRDYNVGADRGGQISMFDDFDIDYNQFKYLIETRISGALIRPYAAQVFWRSSGTEVTNLTVPSFDQATNTITIPTVTGVEYLIDEQVVTGKKVITDDETVTARAKEGYFFAPGSSISWDFTHVAK